MKDNKTFAIKWEIVDEKLLKMAYRALLKNADLTLNKTNNIVEMATEVLLFQENWHLVYPKHHGTIQFTDVGLAMSGIIYDCK